MIRTRIKLRIRVAMSVKTGKRMYKSEEEYENQGVDECGAIIMCECVRIQDKSRVRMRIKMRKRMYMYKD